VTGKMKLTRAVRNILVKKMRKLQRRYIHKFLLDTPCNDIGCRVPKSTNFPHRAIGVVISSGVQLGENVTIYQNVTIGSKGGCPAIGDGVIIGAGAVILGPIRVGNCAVIGANSVVTKDVAAGSIVYGRVEKCSIMTE